MKCEIIRDLLPLYIENLCSEESCKIGRASCRERV